MTECPTCHMMIVDAAWDMHHELNHPKRHTENPAALEKARSILAAKRTARREREQQLEASWEGRGK